MFGILFPSLMILPLVAMTVAIWRIAQREQHSKKEISRGLTISAIVAVVAAVGGAACVYAGESKYEPFTARDFAKAYDLKASGASNETITAYFNAVAMGKIEEIDGPLTGEYFTPSQFTYMSNAENVATRFACGDPDEAVEFYYNFTANPSTSSVSVMMAAFYGAFMVTGSLYWFVRLFIIRRREAKTTQQQPTHYWD